MDTSVILTQEQIAHKTKRIAFQILESNSDDSEIVLAGIIGNGYIFAKKIAEELTAISDVKVTLCKVTMDKRNPLVGVQTDIPAAQYENKPLVLVDDVLNSGTTLMYGIRHFLDVPLKKFNTAVLINRNHKKYPVKADFKGLSLSTSLQEHVNVVFEENTAYAVLA